MRRHLRGRKQILFFLVAILVALAAAWTYLLSVTVPVILHTTLLGEFERATGKKMHIRAISFDLLRGLVLEGVIIYDAKAVLSRTKKVSAYLVLPHLIQKQIIIPYIKIENPHFVLERREDGSFSLEDLLPDEYVPVADLSIAVHRIAIRDGRVWFVDRTLDPDLKRQIERVEADIRVHAPLRITYRLSATVATDPAIPFTVTGEYAFLENRTNATVRVRDISPASIGPYLASLPADLSGGTVDVDATVSGAPVGTTVGLEARLRSLTVGRDALKARLDARVSAAAGRTAPGDPWTWSGTAELGSMALSGLAEMPPVGKIAGRFVFNQERIWSEEMSCEILGIPWQARANIVNFSAPLIDIYASARTRLGALQKALCDECAFHFPLDMAGDAALEVAVTFEEGKPMNLNGYARLGGATMRLGSGLYPLEEIAGEVHFTPERLDWENLTFVYRGMPFITTGVLTDFAAPALTLAAAAPDLVLEADCVIEGPFLRFGRLAGTYHHSSFDASGDLRVGTTQPEVRLAGSARVDLADVRALAPRSPGVRKMRPAGEVAAEFALAGPLHDPLLPTVHVKATSPAVHLYGVRFSQMALEYLQERGVGSIRTFKANSYGGALKASGRIDWLSRGQPFAVTIDADDVMLERVKLGTPLEESALAGDLKVYAKLTGAFKDLARLEGLGRITISDGNLWELNFFKGLGKAIFTSDFENIIFSEGSCDFRIRDLNFYADGVEMMGELVRLSGVGRVGFDRSLEVLLRPELMETAMPYATDTQRGMAMAVQDGTVIEVTGTLKDPRFRTRTDVLTVMGGVAEAILGRSS